MKTYIKYCFFSLLTIACNGEDIPLVNEEVSTCEEFLERIPELEFKGIIFLCNAQPPLMDFINATATVEIEESTMKIDLVSDSTFIDSTLIYSFSCVLAEKTIPQVSLISSGAKEGGISIKPYRIAFHFPYNECKLNTSFEGVVIE